MLTVLLKLMLKRIMNVMLYHFTSKWNV